MIALPGRLDRLPAGPFDHGDHFGKVQVVRDNITNISITSRENGRVLTIAMNEEQNLRNIKTFHIADCEPFMEGTYDIVRAERLEQFA